MCLFFILNQSVTDCVGGYFITIINDSNVVMHPKTIFLAH